MALSFAPNSPFRGPINHAEWIYYFEDFMDEYKMDVTGGTTAPEATYSPWVGTVTTDATITMASDAKGGVMLFTAKATTDNSGAQIQQDMETWTLEAGKETWFCARVKTSDATQSELFAGLAITDTELLDGTGTVGGGLTHTDSVGLYKPDGSTQFVGAVRRDSVQANSGSVGTDLANDTYILLEGRVVMDPTTAGKGRAYFYVNGVEVSRVDSTTMPYDSEEVLALSFAFKTGDNSGTKTATLDFIGAAQQR